MNIKSFISLPPSSLAEEGVIVNPPSPLWGDSHSKMAIEKEFRDLLQSKGKLPDEVKGEVYELYYMGAEISVINSVIELRTE
ncbi:MAG TPA: hypothetical protein VMC80_02830 [Patescibacteria group bacterium]|nr:hypothetical protein [Patescibacteria group bacterium]